MKKYNAEVYSLDPSARDSFYFSIILPRGNAIDISHQLSYASKKSAKHAAERIAKKLNIELDWNGK